MNAIHRENEALIAERFPKLNRSLTGYDLAHIRDREGRFDLNAILCGAEGTLGFIAEAELNVLPIPKHSALINIRYDSFDAALRDARALVAMQAASIETVDSRVLALARNDIVWHEVREFFPDDPEGPADGVNLVELLADDADDLEAQLARVTAMLEREGRAAGRRGFTVARNEEPAGDRHAHRRRGAGRLRIAEDGDEAEEDGAAGSHRPLAVKAVERIWGMRKKAVGLLGNMAGSRRPIPFVEDTAVPPEHLADYIAEFRAALDRRGLVYGMFGHVDAGVLHVRPAIDMTDPAQEPLIREISDEVVALTRKYGGVLWGEHGKGVRSEYTPAFFGPLYPCLQQIKAAFDPHNQLNPGKIAAPADGRPAADRRGPDPGRPRAHDPARDPRELRQRAPLQRQRRLLRLRPRRRDVPVLEGDARAPALAQGPGLADARMAAAAGGRRRRSGRGSGEAARHTRLAHASGPAREHDRQAPRRLRLLARGQGGDGRLPRLQGVRRPVPDQGRRAELPGEVLELYHGRYLRPAKDGLVAAIEHLLPWAARMPALYNLAVGSPPGRFVTQTARARRPAAAAGPPPRPRACRARHPDRDAAGSGGAVSGGAGAQRRPRAGRLHQLFRAAARARPGRPAGRVWASCPGWRRSGRTASPCTCMAFSGRFERVAERNAAMLRALAAEGVPLVGLDPSMTLTYRSEYKALGADSVPKVQLVQEWLAQRLDELPEPSGSPARDSYLLLPHCTERTNAAGSLGDWQRVFRRLGLELTVLASGCCGMAGTYGHEARHRATSERIYALSWQEKVAAHGQGGPAARDRLLVPVAGEDHRRRRSPPPSAGSADRPARPNKQGLSY